MKKQLLTFFFVFVISYSLIDYTCSANDATTDVKSKQLQEGITSSGNRYKIVGVTFDLTDDTDLEGEVMFDDAEPAIALIEGNRLVEIRHMQSAVGEFGCHSVRSAGSSPLAAASARSTAATASRISPNWARTQ